MKLDNETVKNWAKTTYDVPKDASIQDVCFSTAFIAAHEMAIDLLEARAQLAIAVKALEEIQAFDTGTWDKPIPFSELWRQARNISDNALKEIQG